jgi:hypothetical protein
MKLSNSKHPPTKQTKNHQTQSNKLTLVIRLVGFPASPPFGSINRRMRLQFCSHRVVGFSLSPSEHQQRPSNHAPQSSTNLALIRLTLDDRTFKARPNRRRTAFHDNSAREDSGRVRCKHQIVRDAGVVYEALHVGEIGAGAAWA